MYCKAEESNLCFFCDEEHHAKLGKLVNKHIRVPINEVTIILLAFGFLKDNEYLDKPYSFWFYCNA